MKKVIYTLNLNKEFYKPITDITYPWLKVYANKIEADFVEITERKFPEWTITYEKLQIYELGQKNKNDWNIFIDCDALIHPDTPDFTNFLSKDTVSHHGSDMAGYRFRYDRFFKRDGRNIGSATWMCFASDWCIELFKPIDDLTPKEVYSNIFPISKEVASGVTPDRLVEDYVMSRNIAKYGLKFKSIIDISNGLGLDSSNLFHHLYAVPMEEKVMRLVKCANAWGLR